MSVVDKFFKPSPNPSPSHPGGEQAVLIYLEGEDFDIMLMLSDKLTEAIENSGLGMFDGNEIGGNETVLFMYGPDAELLFKEIEPILREDEFCRGAKAIIRWGGPGSPQREVIL
jgi:hypothetical protein